MSYVIDVTEKLKSGLNDLDNLLLNMVAGALPEHLTIDEVSLLEKEYGDNWFEDMGYVEPQYKKPNFIKK